MQHWDEEPEIYILTNLEAVTYSAHYDHLEEALIEIHTNKLLETVTDNTQKFRTE